MTEHASAADCDVFWGSHGCYQRYGHLGPHTCYCGDQPSATVLLYGAHAPRNQGIRALRRLLCEREPFLDPPTVTGGDLRADCHRLLDRILDGTPADPAMAVALGGSSFPGSGLHMLLRSLAGELFGDEAAALAVIAAAAAAVAEHAVPLAEEARAVHRATHHSADDA